MLAYLEQEYPGAELPTRRSIEQHLKLLKEEYDVITLEHYGQELVYKIKTDTNDIYFTRVYHKQIEQLLTCTNRNTLKVFIILKYTLKEGEYKQVTRKYIAEKLGLSSNSDNNLRKIGLILNTLCQLGFITRQEHYDLYSNKRIYKYKINTWEEYNEAQHRGTTYKCIKKERSK